MSLGVYYGAIILGLVYGLMVLGVYLTFRVLNFPDLTIDGSITLGAAVAASLIIIGVNPVAATLVAPLAGALAGLVTGILHTKFQITPLLAGILTMIGLYSINLRIMGRPNMPLLGQDVVFDYPTRLGLTTRSSEFVLGLIIIFFFVFLLNYFLNTEVGQALRATGNNEMMMRTLGVNTDNFKIMGLVLSNALIALSGALVAQVQGFADISMGIGMIIVGLASVIVGEVVIGSSSVRRVLIAVVMGSIIYRLVIAMVLRLGFQATDLKLFTALIVTMALISPQLKTYLRKARARVLKKPGLAPKQETVTPKQEGGKEFAGD